MGQLRFPVITHDIIFRDNGTASCLHTDAIPLRELGTLSVRRASTVEFNEAAQAWEVCLASTPDTVSFSNPDRDICLQWERGHLQSLPDL